MSRESKFIGSHKHKLCVFLVRSTYADGRPKDLTIIHDDITAKLSEDSSENVFITGYLREEHTIAKPK